MVSLRITAEGAMRISLVSRGLEQRLTGSDQANEDCDDQKEYRNVFDNLPRSQFHNRAWKRSNTHDGATLLPQFNVEYGRMNLL